MRNEASGQGILFYCHTIDDVRQGNFCCGHEPPAVCGLVAVFAKLRELTGAIHHLLFYKNRSPGFGQAIFLDVRV